jgi:uncharacterized protein YjiS (DUF1127 family)
MNSKTWITTGRNNPAAPRASVIVAFAVGAWGWATTVYRRGAQRHQLGGLTDHQLRDIGLTRAEIDRESRKPFWRG